MPEFSPRSYDDLLALVEATPPFVPGATGRAAANQSAQPTSPPAPPVAGGRPGTLPAGSGETSAAAPPRTFTAREAETFSERECMEALQLVVLGTVGEGKVKIFSRYHRTTRIISDISRMKYENLLQLAGAPVRSRVLDVATDDAGPGQYTMRDVKRSIAMLAGFRTITDGGEVGSGCWSGMSEDGHTAHDSVVIVGNAEAAIWNGDQVLHRIDQPLARGRLLAFDQAAQNWYNFEQLRDLMQQAKQQDFREKAMYDCIRLFNRWRWKHSTATPIILAGLAFASWVETLWEWRPLVSVIGPTSSGKSMFCKTVKGIFGALGKSCSDQTAAGVRQMIESSARVFLLDEFDAKDKHQSNEQQKTLKMLRTGGRGDAIVRGQANQKVVETHLRHIVWLLGIQIASPDQADRNRFITGELLPPLEADRGKLTIPEHAELEDLGQRMLATAIYCIHDARKLALKIKDTRVSGVDDRIVESHAVPAAMLAVIQGQDEAAARQTLTEMLLPLAAEEVAGVSDEQSLMTDLLSSRIQIGPVRLAASQMISNVIKEGPSDVDAHKLALESVGLKIDHFMLPGKAKGGPCFLIAPAIVAEQLLKNTRWANQAIDQILRRIPGAVWSRRRVGEQRAQTVALPLEYFAAEFLGLDVGLPISGAGGTGDF